MSQIGIRLKIELSSQILDTKLLDSNFSKFMYYLDKNKHERIDQLQYDLFEKIFIQKFKNLNHSTLKLSIDDFEVPVFETTSIFRDDDIVL